MRNYKQEYANYDGTEAVKKKRAQRNKARRMLEATGAVHKGDGKDVDHKNGDALDNRPSNLRVMDRGKNRGRDNNKWRD